MGKCPHTLTILFCKICTLDRDHDVFEQAVERARLADQHRAVSAVDGNIGERDISDNGTLQKLSEQTARAAILVRERVEVGDRVSSAVKNALKTDIIVLTCVVKTDAVNTCKTYSLRRPGISACRARHLNSRLGGVEICRNDIVTVHKRCSLIRLRDRRQIVCTVDDHRHDGNAHLVLVVRVGEERHGKVSVRLAAEDALRRFLCQPVGLFMAHPRPIARSVHAGTERAA